MVSLGCILQACALGILMLLGSDISPKFEFNAWIGAAFGCIAWVAGMCILIARAEVIDRWRKKSGRG